MTRFEDQAALDRAAAERPRHLISRRGILRASLGTGVATLGLPPRRSYGLAEFGSLGSNRTDHTKVLIAALASGEVDIVLPPRQLNVETPLVLTVDGQTLRGAGPRSVLYNAKPSGSAAEPLLISPPELSDTSISDLSISARGAAMAQPRSRNATSVYYGSAVVVSSNRARCARLWIKDAWDNGLAVASVISGRGVFGAPADFIGEMIRTFNCGCGYHGLGGPGRIGSGINIISGTNFLLSGCIDRNSNGAQTVDDGGGASGRIANCSGYENPLNGDGTGACFYSGSSDVSFTDCQAYFPRGYGYWLAGGCQVEGGFVWGAAMGGVRITRNHVMISSLRLKDICSVALAPNSSQACIVIDSTLEVLDNIFINQTISFSTQALLPRFGLLERAANGRKISATIVNCDLHGSDENYRIERETKVIDGGR